VEGGAGEKFIRASSETVATLKQCVDPKESDSHFKHEDMAMESLS